MRLDKEKYEVEFAYTLVEIAGKQKVDTRFTAETMVDKIEQVYEELLKMMVHLL